MNNLKITFVNLFIASLLFVGYLTAEAQTVDVRFGNNAVDCSGTVPQLCLNIEIKSSAGAGSLTVGNCNFYGQYNELALAYNGGYTELGFNTGLYPADHNDFSGFGFISIAWIYDNGEANALSIDENVWSPVGQLCFDIADETADPNIVLDPFFNLSVRNGGNTVTYTNNYPDGTNFSPSLDCPTASCAISGVAATTAACINDNDASFEVSFTATNGSGTYNVVDGNGVTLGSGATSPITVTTAGTGATITANVVDAADGTCAGTAVSVVLPTCEPAPVCAITGVSATAAACINDNDASFEVSFTAANGSGTYNVVDGNGVTLGSGATSPITVTTAGTGATITANVVDAADGTCAGTAVSVVLPTCEPAPVCAITGVSATAAACINDNDASFEVSFTAANGSGTYNVVDGNGVTLGSGATSPITVTTAGTGATISVNVVDAADGTCAGTAVGVVLPLCEPNPCAITISSVTQDCNTDGTYNLTVNVDYSNEPAGLMEIEVDGNSVGTISAGATSGTVSNLAADGETNVAVVVSFVADATCVAPAVTYDEPTCNVTPVCAVSNVAATAAACIDETNASFEVSFTVVDGSGSYNVVNANGDVLATADASPISITAAGDGSTISVNVVDAADASCAGTAVDVVLPICEPAPVCAIADVAANAATCAGTSATFEVSFTATNGSGSYNVINASNAIIGSGDASPIIVTVADATGGDISVNVADANDAACVGTAVTVSLPDCSIVTPVCSISDVSATAPACLNDVDASFEVSFTAVDGSGSYNVVNANGDVLANGSASPISITAAGDGSTISVNVVDAADGTCAGTAVDVVLPNCEPAPVCAISDVAASAAACADDTNASFEVSFTATNGSGSYSVVDANGTVLATADASPISVTVAGDGSTISVNVADANDATCAGTAVDVVLPICEPTPVCSISDVSASAAACIDDANASFEVSFTATDASGSYNVVNANGDVLATAAASPISVTVAGNGTTLSVNVVDAADNTCAGTAVDVVLPVCEPNPVCAEFSLATGVSGSICSGEMLSASIVAIGGNLPYTVQWQVNGNDMAGETDDAIMITATTADNCLAEGLVLTAIVTCEGNSTTIDAGNVQIFPEPQAPSTSYDAETCTTSVIDACSGNVVETYTANAGDAATTISVSINGSSCGNSSFDIAIPACEEDVIECTTPPDASVMTPSSAFCAEDGGTMYDLMQLVTGDMNGTWSSTDPDDVMNNMFVIPSNQGNAILTYTVAGVFPCEDASTTITVMIDDCNAPPVVTPILLNVSAGTTSTSFNVLDGASDPDGDTFTLANVQSGNANIDIQFNADGSVNITNIPAGFTGAINLTYTVTDGSESSTGTIEILVSDCLAQAGIIGDPNSDKPDVFSCANDNSVSFAATGFNTNFTQQYLLVLNGNIIQISTAGVFTNPEPGTYEVYAINYDPALAPDLSVPTITSLVNGSADGCYDVAGPASFVALTPVEVEVQAYCPVDPTVSGYGVYFVDVCISGGFPTYSGFGSYALSFPPYNVVYNSENGDCASMTLQTNDGAPFPFPNGTPCFLIDVESDGLLCSVGSIEVCGVECPEPPACDPIPGTIQTPNFVCAGDDVTVVAVSSEIEEDEVGTYILHDGNINNILATSPTGTFSAASVGGACGTTPYFVSFVVGQSASAVDGIPNLSDTECTAISNAAEVYFLCDIQVTYNVVENESEENFNVIVESVTGGFTTDGMYNVDSNTSFVGQVSGTETTIIGPLACGVEVELTFSDAAGCSTLVIENVDCKPTPIELIHFSGEVQEEGNLLKWITATEINNDYFTMYRSADGITFEAIGTVEGAGNSVTAIAYELMDKTAPSGLSYYRLDQTDFDGTTTSSNIISLVRGEQGFGLVELLPVPAIDFVNIRFTSATRADVNLAVYNVAGALISTDVVEAQNGINAIQLDVANYPNGVYFLSLNNGEEVVNVKFIKD